VNEAADFAPDPSARLEAAFRRVHAERMQGLAFVNPALAVDAVGFAPWEGRWLGVIVTPWSINLALLPYDPAEWRSLEPGAKREYRFPAGTYEFIGAHDDAIGEFQTCSLFSPALDFADQHTARLTAQCARAALLDRAHADESAPRERREAPPPSGAMSKRDFLRARFPR
jgi:[NiFe] hydrogenase assembly HybE family chaperone